MSLYVIKVTSKLPLHLIHFTEHSEIRYMFTIMSNGQTNHNKKLQLSMCLFATIYIKGCLYIN